MFSGMNLADWATFVQIAGGIGVVVAMVYLRSQFVSRKAHEDHCRKIDESFADIGKRLSAQSERLNRGDSRFDSLDEHLKALPSREDLHKNTLALERLSGDVRVSNTEVQAIKRQVAVIDDYLRQRDK